MAGKRREIKGEGGLEQRGTRDKEWGEARGGRKVRGK